MSDWIISADATSQIKEVVVRGTDGGGKTGLAHTDVTASYVREGGTRTAITLAAGTAGDAYSSGKWAEVDATNMKGVYQLHIPNAALATGVDRVTIGLQATGMIDYEKGIALNVATPADLVTEFSVYTVSGKFFRSATKDQYILIPCLNGIAIAQASISTPLVSVLLKDDTVVVNAQTPVVFGTKAWVHEERSEERRVGQVAEVAFTFTYDGAEYTRYCSVGRNA